MRTARPGDAAGIAGVHIQAWNETYRGLIPDAYLASRRAEDKLLMWERSIAESLEPASGRRLWVVDDPTGRVVGMSFCGKSRDRALGYDSEVYAIYLLREHHGRGIGALLMREAFRWLRKQGCAGAMLWVLEGNPTERFYARMGGVRLAETKDVDFGGTLARELAYGWTLAR